MTDPLKKSNSGLKRRPFLTPIWLAAFSAAVVVSFVTWLWSTADSTTVVVVRAAESDAGAAMLGQILADRLGDAASPGHIGVIYCVPGSAAKATAAAVAGRLGLVPVEFQEPDPRAWAARVLRDHAGARVLIVAGGAAIPELVTELGARETVRPPAADEFDTMYVVTMPRIGRANFVRLRY